MTVTGRRMGVRTQGNNATQDVTLMVARAVEESGLRTGIVTLFVPGSTGGLTTIEFESGAVADLDGLLERVAPGEIEYRHNLRWGDGNGHSHVRAALIGPSLTVPFQEGRLTLGTWQQIIFIDFDTRPRRREIVVQILGDG